MRTFRPLALLMLSAIVFLITPSLHAQWSTATISQARFHLSSTTVGTRVLFAGGFGTSDQGNTYSNRVDIYDINTLAWSQATLSQSRSNLAATAVGTKAFFGGGDINNTYSNVVDIYEYNSRTWSTAILSQARGSLCATSVGSKVFFAGGTPIGGSPASDIVDVYNNSTDTWTTASLSQARYNLAATSVGTKAFFAGGDIVDIYDDNTNTWTTATLSQSRYLLTATSVGTKVFFAGGKSSLGVSDVVDIYDNNTSTWTTAKLAQARSLLSATTVGNKVFFAGGEIGGGTASNVVDVYDNSTDTWTTTTLSSSRHGLTATSVGTKAFFAGGAGPYLSYTVDIYDISAPIISSFAPTSGAIGTTVTITGINLTGATAVSFGGTAAASFTVNSSTSITAVVALGSSGTVSITTPGGTASKAGFTFSNVINPLNLFKVSDIDGNEYPTIKMNTQHWMQKNLIVTNDTLGNPIPYRTESFPLERYYNWETALRICPTGYRLPSLADWETLSNEKGLQSVEFKLELPGGYVESGTIYTGTNLGYYWTSNPYSSSQAFYLQLYNTVYTTGQGEYLQWIKQNMFSVRCIKDDFLEQPQFSTTKHIRPTEVKLNWDYVTNNDASSNVIGFLLERKLKDADNSKYSILDTIQSIHPVNTVGKSEISSYSFIDNGLSEGTEYTYRIIAFNNFVNAYPITADIRTGETIRVPGNFVKIQDAYNYAKDNDYILVGPGEYFINLKFNKSITLRSTEGASNTILRPLNLGEAIISHTSGVSSATISGFKFTQGGDRRGSALDFYLPQTTDFIVENCIFFNNGGSSVHLYYAGPTFMNCIFNNGESIFADPNPFKPVFFNCILNGSISSPSSSDSPYLFVNSYLKNVPFGRFEINYCNVKGGWKGADGSNLGIGNFDLEPEFIDSENRDFRLKDNSPMIGAGIDSIWVDGMLFCSPKYDFNGNERSNPPNSKPDIGAYESILGEPKLPVSQTISMTTLTNVLETIGKFTLTAIASSGLPVSFITEDTKKVSISGNTVTILGPGKVIITANQIGNTEYLAATSISQSFCVLPKKPSISSSGLGSENLILTSSSTTGNQWYLNESLIPLATAQTFNATEQGSYKVTVTIDGCIGEFSDAFSVIITKVDDPQNFDVSLYPNPAQQNLNIVLNMANEHTSSQLVVYDMLGRNIARQIIFGKHGSLMTDQFPCGNYILRIESNSILYNLRFVKQ